MTAINIYGEFPENPSGYGSHMRGVALGLDKLNPEEIGYECPLPAGWDRLTQDKFIRMMQRHPKVRRESTISITLPAIGLLKAADRPKKLLQYCVFEGDKIPTWWAQVLQDRRFHRILVPSQHTLEAIKNTAPELAQKTRIVSHGHDTEIFKPKKKDETNLNNIRSALKNFVFGYVGGWAQGRNDRKDLALALRAYCAEFKPEDDVSFLVKINMAYNRNIDILQELNNAGLPPPEQRPSIIIVTEDCRPDQLADLYNLMDVMVCPSRAEAFGLTFLEAMACGKPCIAGGYGGQTDFVNASNGWLLDKYELKPVPDQGPYSHYEGIRWAEYDEKQCRELMRKAHEDKEQREAKGKNALETAKSLTWENTAKKIMEVLNEPD